MLSEDVAGDFFVVNVEGEDGFIFGSCDERVGEVDVAFGLPEGG